MKRKILLLIALVLVTALLGACSSARKEEAKSGAPQMADNAAGRGESASSAPAPAPAAKPAEPGTPNGGGNAPIDLPADRKIILNASFDVKIKEADDAINKISAAVRAAGGYVQENRQQGTKVQGRRVNMSLRVPAGQYGAITDLIRSLGEVSDQREWTEDVTAQYVDLEERIKTKEVHLTQLHKLYGQGGTIKELMELESEINRVTSDLESMKGQMRVLTNRVDFSTVLVNLYEPGAPVPIQPPKTVWERMQRGFIDSWNGVINFMGNLVVFVVASLPILVLLAIFGGIALLIVRWSNKRFRRPPNPPSPPPYVPPFPPDQNK
ncbi:MAG TPA: DUF4349 domain-containing protein [Symbiobacteriaceae bacterium]|nr:DUF4349 domain-containing protein [Symbiobacteriaceae bacterium]